jgi:hypothetical protein
VCQNSDLIFLAFLVRDFWAAGQPWIGGRRNKSHCRMNSFGVHEVTIACAGEVVARHPRSYEREVVMYDPLHYLALLEQKTRALDQAAPLAGWKLPECFATLRRLLEARLKKHGGREYVQVLRLLETFSPVELTRAIEDALHLGTISFDAVRHLLLCRIERRPPRLDMENYPHLPMAEVRATQASDYMTLLEGASA